MRGWKFVLCAILMVSALAGPAQAHHAGVHALIVEGPPPFTPSTSAKFNFLSDSDTSVDSCKLDDQAPAPCSKPSKTYTDMVPGTHTVTVHGTWHHTYCDVGGCSYEPDPRTDSWTWTVADVTKPTVTMTSPSAPFQLASDVTVTWTGSDGEGLGIDEYTVRSKTARGDQDFGDVTTEVVDGSQVSLPPVHIGGGFTKCFSVSAKDIAGNESAFTPWQCTAKPWDDMDMEVNSPPWTLISSDEKYWNATATKTTILGAKMKSPVTLQVKRVGVVATVCPTCGSVRVKVGTTAIGTISLVAPETKHQRIRSLPVFPLEIGTLKVITTTSGKLVKIDGVAFSRK